MGHHRANVARQAAWRSSEGCRRVLNGIFYILRTGSPWRESTTGWQTVTTRDSEVLLAQPVSEIIAIARAASRCVVHLALDVQEFDQLLGADDHRSTASAASLPVRFNG